MCFHQPFKKSVDLSMYVLLVLKHISNFILYKCSFVNLLDIYLNYLEAKRYIHSKIWINIIFYNLLFQITLFQTCI